MEFRTYPAETGAVGSPKAPAHDDFSVYEPSASRRRVLARSNGPRAARAFPSSAGLLLATVLMGAFAQVPSAYAEEAAAEEKADGKPADSKTGEKVWVDVARSHLRSGPGTDSESVIIVSAGQELEVVAVQDDWFKVSTSSGKVGWLSRRAVTTTAPTPVVVKSLEKKLAAVQSENEQISQEMRRLADARQELELQTSKLRTEAAIVQAQNEELKSWRIWMWGLLGLVVLLVGWVLGFITGTLKRQADDRRYESLKKDATQRRV